MIDISRLINDRNRAMFKKVESKYILNFEPSYNGEHSVYTIQNNMTFYIPVGIYSPDSFTHELLHGYIDYHEAFIGGNFKITMWQSNIYKQIFDAPLAEHITNCIVHTLMLPLYLQMGFERSKFLYDYDTFKAEPGIINLIAIHYRQGNQYNYTAIRNFIGKYFAFQCDPNPAFDYTFELAQFKKIDRHLYQIIDSYFLQWADYDFTNDLNSSYQDKNAYLYSQMKAWLNGKKFFS